MSYHNAAFYFFICDNVKTNTQTIFKDAIRWLQQISRKNKWLPLISQFSNCLYKLICNFRWNILAYFGIEESYRWWIVKTRMMTTNCNLSNISFDDNTLLIGKTHVHCFIIHITFFALCQKKLNDFSNDKLIDEK